MSDITVLTSITGGKDALTIGNSKGNAKWIAYSDEFESDQWDMRSPYDGFKSDRRNSRFPKILSHLSTDTKYSIWIDGNLKLIMPPEEVVEKYLNGYDLATFKHPVRNCIYDEAILCAKARLDDPEVIIEQVSRYEKDGYAKQRGLCECMMIVRRHTPKVEQFNNLWWAEYCRGSVRDQLSFMYCADKVGLRVNVINEQFKETEDKRLVRGGIIEIVEHLTPRAEPL
jgi:hypothetical protein